MSWQQTQQETWNANNDYNNNNTQQAEDEYYSDESYEDDEDDEYEPINVASWGTQTVNQAGTTEVTMSVAGWNSLIDPSVKVKEGGIGSGQLHRRGANFKPLDEQHIINQRLGKPIPKAISGSKKKSRGGKKKPFASRPPPPPRSSGPPLRPPSSSQYRGREPLPNSGPWGSGQLLSTPFWESSNTATNSNASKWSNNTPAPAATPSAAPPVQQTANQWQQAASAPNSLQAPAAPPVRQPAQSGYVPSSHASVASKYATNSQASKYATPAAPPQQYQQPQAQYNPAPQQYQQQPAAPVQQEQQQHIQKISLDTPCLNFNIEMTPGVNATLLVYEDDDPIRVVDQFEKDHHLVMSDMAKRKFAEKVRMLLLQYKA